MPSIETLGVDPPMPPNLERNFPDETAIQPYVARRFGHLGRFTSRASPQWENCSDHARSYTAELGQGAVATECACAVAA